LRICLIPSSIIVDSELQRNFGQIPSCLLPYQQKTLLQILEERYGKFCEEIYVIGHQKAILIEQEIKFHNLKSKLFIIEKLEDLGHSIFECLNYISKRKSLDNVTNLIIIFGDTLVEPYLHKEKKDYLYYSVEKDKIGWTSCDLDENHITEIYDKDIEKINQSSFNIIVGFFSFSDPGRLLENLKFEIDNVRSQSLDKDSFYQAILKYNEILPIKGLEVKNWIDLGHLNKERYQNYRIAERTFNTIKIDQDRGILRKESLYREKFISEIKWYLNFPSDLSYLVPRIFKYSINKDPLFLELEFYGYPSLSEIYIFGNKPLWQWRQIIEKVFMIINLFSRKKIQIDETTIKSSLLKMYYNKTFDRLSSIKDNPVFASYFDTPKKINGRSCMSLNQILTLLKEFIKKICFEDLSGFTLIHGDFCFSNILYEPTNKFIRLIDPRGKFGNFEQYGDPNYDLAKLFHSIIGGYDFMINDLFSLNESENVVELKFPKKSIHEEIEILFKDRLKESGVNIIKIRLIESLLFLSMVPLHSENELRQKFMLLWGIYRFTTLINEHYDPNLQ